MRLVNAYAVLTTTVIHTRDIDEKMDVHNAFYWDP